ncbi:hypothetical protein TNCV_2988321 [Trichonephila clavipes]|nr:hypothetical protein TNCV_2988321 [Trichonephila clavipes]
MSIGKFKKDELRSIVEELKLVSPDNAKVLDLRELIQEIEIYKNDKEMYQAIIDCVLEQINDRRNEDENRRKDNENRLEIEKIKLSQNYLDEGIIEKVTNSFISTNDPVLYFPHQAIIKNESLTTKQQILFHASAFERRVLKKEMGSEKSDEDMELPQATERVIPLESERAKMLSMGPDDVAQPVTVPEKKGLLEYC